MSTSYNEDTYSYEFTVTSASSEACISIEAAQVEKAVAERTVINPTLEGGLLYLRFASPGDGFSKHAEETNRAPVAISWLVEFFLEGSELKDDAPEEYKAAVVELYRELRAAAGTVYNRARAIEAIPDPFSDEAFPDLTKGLIALGIRKQ